MIVLNLKNYEQTYSKIYELVDIAKEVSKESGLRIVVCPPNLLLEGVVRPITRTQCFPQVPDKDIFAQHSDETDFGATTGSIPVKALKLLGVGGSLVNHSENRIEISRIEKIVKNLKKNNMDSIVCAESPKEVKKIKEFKPKYIAIEPPELIGSGISISKAKPELITDSLKVLENSKVDLLCGAGVANKDDVKKALDLGSYGVLLASAYVKSKNPKEFLEKLVEPF